MGKELGHDFYDRVYKSGGKNYKYFKNYNNTAWADIWETVCKILKRHNVSNILDIGCGPGQFAQCASNFDFASYTGIDFSKEAIELARKKMQSVDMVSNFFVESLYDFDFESIGYDCVVATEFLEHIGKDREILSKIRSGTLIVASLPNKDSAGHVRHFPGKFLVAKENIENRYRDIGDFLSFESVMYSGGKNHDYVFSIRKK